MTFERWKSSNRTLLVGGLALLTWLAGFGAMELPLGGFFFRLGYDWLHLVTSHPPAERIAVVVINESTDRKLNRVSHEPFSRRFHAQLLRRLKEAGVERVCYDILFDLPSADGPADAEFRDAIRSHGHVVLGAAEQATRRDRVTMQTETIMPVALLRDAAEGWGILNVPQPDADGVVRRMSAESEARPTLAAVALRAARAAQGTEPELPASDAWYYYQALPGNLPTFEFSDCLDPVKVPDGLLRGHTVFVGGAYSSTAAGRPDSFPTPYARFGGPEIPGVVWHATAFANLRDSLWFRSTSIAWNALLSLLLPLAWFGIFTFRRKRWELFVLLSAATGGILLASVYVSWGERVVLAWPAVALLQLPLCLLGANIAGRRPAELGVAQIFVSAVSNEFGSYRPALKVGFDRLWSTGRTQSDFLQSGHYTLEKIDNYIKACDAVVHLCGDMTGSAPTASDLSATMTKYPDLAGKIPGLETMLAPGGLPPSYTQLEAYLAVYHRKFLIIACPLPGAERDPAIAGDDDQRKAQQAHLKRLRDAEKFPEIRFKDPDNLVNAILRSDLYEEILKKKLS